MKKYVSIVALLTRSTIYKVLLVLVAMGAIEVAMFMQKMPEMIAVVDYSLELMVDSSNLEGFFGLAFVLLTAILCWNGCDVGSKSSYTLQRLQVSEKTVLLLQSMYNCICYALLLGAQVLIFLIICNLYVKTSTDVSNQTVFLAFYRNDFMHSVLPMESTFRWVMNGLLVLGCGVNAAVFSYIQRRGKLAFSMLVTVACIILGFTREIGGRMIMVTAFLVMIIAGVTAYRHVFQKKEEK